MLNKVQLIGRLGQEPQLKYTRTGSPIANFSVATDDSYTDREGNRQSHTEWHRIVVFQKTAENCGRFLHKGSLVYVEGSLQTHKWQDQQGIDRYTTEVKAQRVVFLDKRPPADDGMNQRPYDGQAGQDYPPVQPVQGGGSDSGMGGEEYMPSYGGYEGNDDYGSPFPGGAQGESVTDSRSSGSAGSEERPLTDEVPF